MNGQHVSGLEVALPAGLEQVAPSNINLQDKYSHYDPPQETLIEDDLQRPWGQTSYASKPERRWCGRRPSFWILAVIIVVCLAAALGGAWPEDLLLNERGLFHKRRLLRHVDDGKDFTKIGLALLRQQTTRRPQHSLARRLRHPLLPQERPSHPALLATGRPT